MDDDELRALLTSGYRYALSLCHDPGQAEDLVQEAWASVLSAGATWSKTYLFRAIRSRFIDGHRRGKVVQFELHDTPEQFVSTTRSTGLDRHRLQQALAHLDPAEREILYLTAVEGYTTREVGEFLDRPRNTILSTLHRARARVQAWQARDEREAAR